MFWIKHIVLMAGIKCWCWYVGLGAALESYREIFGNNNTNEERLTQLRHYLLC